MVRAPRNFAEFMGDAPVSRNGEQRKKCWVHDYVRCGPELAMCAKCGKYEWHRPDGRIESYNVPGYRGGFPIPGYVPPDRCATHTHEYSDMIEKAKRIEIVRETPFAVLKQEYVIRICPVCGEERELGNGQRWELKETKKA